VNRGRVLPIDARQTAITMKLDADVSQRHFALISRLKRVVLPESVVKTHGEFDFSAYFTQFSLRFRFLTKF